MELRRYLAILRRRLVFIVVCVAVALTGSYITTPQDTKYVAISTIYVGSRQLQSQNNNPNFNDSLQTVERSITTFALMIDSRPTAAAALELTGIPRSEEGVVGATTTYAIPNTQLILVIVSDPDPAIARDLANGMATAFVSKVQQFEPTAQAAEGTVPSLPAYVFERANLPTVPWHADLNHPTCSWPASSVPCLPPALPSSSTTSTSPCAARPTPSAGWSCRCWVRSQSTTSNPTLHNER